MLHQTYIESLLFYDAFATHQILVSDRGKVAFHRYGKGINVWEPLKNCDIKVERLADRWIIKAALPYKAFGSAAPELRFNLIRTDRAGGKPVEYGTYCPLAIFGVWHISDNYGTVIVK